jgi:hypothetical protein
VPPAPRGWALCRREGRRGYLYFFSLGSSLLAKGLVHAAPVTGLTSEFPRFEASTNTVRRLRGY